MNEQSVEWQIEVDSWTKFPTDETEKVWSDIEWEKRHSWVRRVVGNMQRGNWSAHYLTNTDLEQMRLMLALRGPDERIISLGVLTSGLYSSRLTSGTWQLVVVHRESGASATILSFDVDASRHYRRGQLSIGPETQRRLVWLPTEP